MATKFSGLFGLWNSATKSSGLFGWSNLVWIFSILNCEHIYLSDIRNHSLTFDLVLDFVNIQNFGRKYKSVSTSQVDFFWLIISFVLDCKKHYRTANCHRFRRASMSYNPVKGHFGFLSEALFQQFIDNYLIIEHLWVGDIVMKENPVQSKFLPVYVCVKELHNLFVSCICPGILKNLAE